MQKLWKKMNAKWDLLSISQLKSLFYKGRYKLHPYIKSKWSIFVLLLAIIPSSIFLFYTYMLAPFIFVPDFLIWDEKKQGIQTAYARFVRDRAWLFWMLFSMIGVFIGIYLTWQGKNTQKKQWLTQQETYLDERYEKAADMLGSNVISVRVAGCQSIGKLGISNNSMASQCIRLLLSFIQEPYIESEKKHRSLNTIFSFDEPLRSDIQVAVDQLTEIRKNLTIPEHNRMNDLITFPSYFLKNQEKNKISLAGFNLENQDMNEAFLLDTDLSNANLKHTRLERSVLKRAIFVHTDMREVKLMDSDLKDALFDNAELMNAKLDNANLQQARLYKTGLERASLVNADLDDAILTETNLKYAKLQEAFLVRAKLEKVNLSYANLSKAKIQNALLQDTDLENAILQETDLTNSDMKTVTGLSKSQILSAVWGITFSNDHPPILPDDLQQDNEIIKWLKEPTYEDPEAADLDDWMGHDFRSFE